MRATATDSAQPISQRAVRRSGSCRGCRCSTSSAAPSRLDAFGELPAGVSPCRSRRRGPPTGRHRLAATVDALDARCSASPTRIDHAFLAGRAGRLLYRAPDGAPVGYGYAAEAGRVGPVAVRDAALLGPVLGHLICGVRRAARSRSGCRARPATRSAPRCGPGFRLEAFPVLLCWDRPFVDFARYLPISPGLL